MYYFNLPQTTMNSAKMEMIWNGKLPIAGSLL